jgi:hypothetical protein
MVRRVKVKFKNEKFDLSLPALKIKTLQKLVALTVRLSKYEEGDGKLETVETLMLVSSFLDEVIDSLNRVEPFTLLEAVDGNTAITVELK